MKKIKNLLLLALVGGMFSLTACTDDVEREPSPVPTEGIQAYVYADQTDLNFLSSDDQQFVVKVGRQTTEQAATVHLTLDGNEAFHAPATVEFAAGEAVKDIVITFDIPLGSTASVSLSIPQEEAYIYAGSAITFNIVRDYTWLNRGTAKLISSFYGAEGSMQVFEAKEKPLFKLVEPYEQGYNVLIQVEGEQAVIEKQAIAPKYGDYGTLSIEGDGTFKNNVFTMNCHFSVPEGSFGKFPEIYELAQ